MAGEHSEGQAHRARMSDPEARLESLRHDTASRGHHAQPAHDPLSQQTEMLRALVTATDPVRGDDLFHTLIYHVAAVLRVQHTVLAKFDGERQQHLRTLAVITDGDVADNFIVDLPRGPSTQLTPDRLASVEAAIRRRLGRSATSDRAGHDSYYAVPFHDRSGRALGLLVILHCEPLGLSDEVRSVLSLFAGRAGAELERRQVEEALRVSEERLALTAQGSTDALWDGSRLPGAPWDAPENPIWWSPRIRDMLALDPSEPFDTLGHWAARLHPDDKDRVFQALAAHAAHRTPYDVEYRIRTNHGTYLWVRGRGRGVWDEQGEPRRMSGSLQDITARKEAERHLRNSEERFRSLLQNSADIIAVLETDGTIRYESPSFYRLFGYQESDILGRNAFDLIHSDDLPHILGRFQKELPIPGIAPPAVLRYRKADGEYLTLEVLANNLVQDPSVRGIVVTSRDITERQRMEEALRTSEATLRSFFDSGAMMMGIVEIVGEDVRHISTNAATAQFFGSTPEALSGRLCTELGIPRDAIDLWVAKYREAHQNSKPVRFEHQQGDRWLSATVCSIGRGEAGRARFAFVAEDVTDRRRALEDLARRRSELRQALDDRARISQELHDGILQSLYAIGLSLEGARGSLSPQSQRKVGPMFDGVVGQLNRVMRDVRNFISGLDADVVPAAELPTALRKLVTSVDRTRSTRLRSSINAEAAMRLSTEQASQLFRIAQEAISNSLRHSRAKRATVFLRLMKHGVRLTVHDDGIGFDVDAVRRTGHGLMNMATRAQRLGGRFKLSSRINHGTRVVLDIPHEATRAHS